MSGLAGHEWSDARPPPSNFWLVPGLRGRLQSFPGAAELFTSRLQESGCTAVGTVASCRGDRRQDLKSRVHILALTLGSWSLWGTDSAQAPKPPFPGEMGLVLPSQPCRSSGEAHLRQCICKLLYLAKNRLWKI